MLRLRDMMYLKNLKTQNRIGKVCALAAASLIIPTVLYAARITAEAEISRASGVPLVTVKQSKAM